FIVPGTTPPFASVEQAFAGRRPREELVVTRRDIDAVYDSFGNTPAGGAVDFVHLGCPHASFQEMQDYGKLFAGKKKADGVELGITTSRAVKALAEQEGIVKVRSEARALRITDTC